MTMDKAHTVEHTTYNHGDKQEEEAAFFNLYDAHEFALSMIERHGGRVWVNGQEMKRRELELCVNVTARNT